MSLISSLKILLFNIILLFSIAHIAYSADWVPCPVVTRFPDNRIIDIAALVLDPPAGKHGMLINKNGNLVFEDGTKTRFWGVNISLDACFPSHQMAELIASRLAFYGYNAVRFHHLDYGFEPRGIFKDLLPYTKDPQKKRSGVLSPHQLDKLDYFIYQLKRRGIYINLNLLSGRKFTEADSVKYAKELIEISNQAGKPASLFDPHLINLQKSFIRQLLNHYNPYTGLKYCEDPAIAMLELNNENSLFRYWMSGNIDGGKFSAKKQLPSYYLKQIDSLWKEWIKNKYLKTDAESGGTVDFRRPGWKERKLYPDSMVNDVIEFYIDIESRYYTEMIRYIREEIGSRALIGGGGHYFSLAHLKTESITDFTSPHYYWDPAKWPGKRWDRHNFEMAFKSIFDAGTEPSKKKRRNPVEDNAMLHIKTKPLIITEWNQWFPNPYAYELPVILSAYGSFHEWDGAFVFSYRHTLDNVTQWDKIDSFLDIYSNPQKLILSAACGVFYLGNMLTPSREPINVPISDEALFANVRNKGSVRKPDLSWGIDMLTPLAHKVTKSFEDKGLAKERKQLIRKTLLNNVIVSDTRELVWHMKKRVLTINAKMVQGAVGFLGEMGRISLRDINIQSPTNGAILLISLDQKPLSVSGRILLVSVGEIKNTNSIWKRPNISWGRAPILMRNLKAKITLKCFAGRYHIYYLDTNGFVLSEKKLTTEHDTVFIKSPNNAIWAVIEKRN